MTKVLGLWRCWGPMCKNRLRINEFKTPLGFTDIKQRPAVVKEVCWQRILMVMQQANGWCIVPCRSLKKNGRCSQAEPRDIRASNLSMFWPRNSYKIPSKNYIFIFSTSSQHLIFFRSGFWGGQLLFRGWGLKRDPFIVSLFLWVSPPPKKRAERIGVSGSGWPPGRCFWMGVVTSSGREFEGVMDKPDKLTSNIPHNWIFYGKRWWFMPDDLVHMMQMGWKHQLLWKWWNEEYE